MGLGRRAAFTLLAAVALGLVCLPVVLTVVFGWYRTTVLAGITGKGSGIYIILVVFYVFWLPVVLAGVLIAFDRLGYRYEPREAKRPSALRRRQRTIAGVRFLADRPTLGQAGEGEHGERRSEQGRSDKGQSNKGRFERGQSDKGRFGNGGDDAGSSSGAEGGG